MLVNQRSHLSEDVDGGRRESFVTFLLQLMRIWTLQTGRTGRIQSWCWWDWPSQRSSLSWSLWPPSQQETTFSTLGGLGCSGLDLWTDLVATDGTINDRKKAAVVTKFNPKLTSLAAIVLSMFGTTYSHEHWNYKCYEMSCYKHLEYLMLMHWWSTQEFKLRLYLLNVKWCLRHTFLTQSSILWKWMLAVEIFKNKEHAGMQCHLSASVQNKTGLVELFLSHATTFKYFYVYISCIHFMYTFMYRFHTFTRQWDKLTLVCMVWCQFS